MLELLPAEVEEISAFLRTIWTQRRKSCIDIILSVRADKRECPVNEVSG